MAKIVFKKLAMPTARSVGRKAVAMQKETVAGPDGPREIVTIKTGGDTFARDLTYAFGRNVAKARRENKRVTGELDRAPAKA
jgi:hypothetical protein